MSQLSPSPLSGKHYNLITTPAAIGHQFDHTKLGVTAIPDVLDMAPHMAPVFDQGQLSSCTGNTLVGALEYILNKKAGFVNTDAAFIGLSRLFVYYNERMIEGTIREDSGALLSDGIRALSTYGACKEEFFPYDVTKFSHTPSHAAYADGKTRIITQFAQVSITEDAFITTLAGGYPISIGIQIFASFESDKVAHSGLVPMPTPNEESLGGHAVLVSGYDRTKQLLKVRNSWGACWGDKGYFYLPFAYVFGSGLASDTWVIEDIL
jgi:C1A family cysteine protease